MRESTKHVIDSITEMTANIRSDRKTVAEAKSEFLKQVSRVQMEQCLTDPDMNEDDIECCKWTLKYFFEYELPTN